jgi:hypothetical protein
VDAECKPLEERQRGWLEVGAVLQNHLFMEMGVVEFVNPKP